MAFTQVLQDGLNAFLLVVPEHNAWRNWGLGRIKAHMVVMFLQQRSLHQVSPWKSQPRDTAYELHVDVPKWFSLSGEAQKSRTNSANMLIDKRASHSGSP